jgi:hypothetical protein
MSEETPTAGWFTASAIFLTPVGLLRKRLLPICQGILDDRRRVASDSTLTSPVVPFEAICFRSSAQRWTR